MDDDDDSSDDDVAGRDAIHAILDPDDLDDDYTLNDIGLALRLATDQR